MRRWFVLFAATALGVPFLAGCGSDTVQISFRPKVGASYRYEVKVHTVTITRLGDAPPETVVDDAVLTADDTVLSSGPDGVRVRVRLRRPRLPDRTYVVRLDRAAQLAGVEEVEGLPPAVLGPEALPEILPGAPGAPPNRPLGPGEQWTIDARPARPGTEVGRLQGSGRLLELGVVNGLDVATTKSHTLLPLRSTAGVRGGTLLLSGTEATETTATRAINDGAIETSLSLTSGRFGVTLAPPSPDSGPPVTGTLAIEVRSETRRLRP